MSSSADIQATTPPPATSQAPPSLRHPLRRSLVGRIGLMFLVFIMVACVGSLWWTMGRVRRPGANPDQAGVPRYAFQIREARHLPPSWWPFAPDRDLAERLQATAVSAARVAHARQFNLSLDQLDATGWTPTDADLRQSRPFFLMGADSLGQDVFVRCLAGGGISLTIGVLAAALSVLVGTVYGTIAGYLGGRVDAVMMRIVDVLYGLPYVLLVVLLAVAADAVLDEYLTRSGARASYMKSEGARALAAENIAVNRGAVMDTLAEHPALLKELEAKALEAYPERHISDETRIAYDLTSLLVAIGGVSWLTMARVVRGQVLSLKSQPFIEAARAIGTPVHRIFRWHLLPNLVGPIIVYATLTVPQAILQESFLSFLGIGVKPPVPSWGSLAADGREEINPFHLAESHWWMLVFPCLLLGCTLLALNFVGEGLREALDPKRRQRTTT